MINKAKKNSVRLLKGLVYGRSTPSHRDWPAIFFMTMVTILPDINQSHKLLHSIFLGAPDLTEYVYIDNEYHGSC